MISQICTILGVYDGHNAGAALVVDGRIVAAAEEERFSRVKNHDARRPDLSAPDASVSACLQHAKGDIDIVALALQEPDTLQQAVNLTYTEAVSTGYSPAFSQMGDSEVLTEPGRFQRERVAKIKRSLSANGIDVNRVQFVHVNHHHAHAAAAYYASEKNEAIVVTLDGKGDNLSGSVSIGRNGVLRTVHEIGYLHSIGHFYSAITAACGFQPMRHEGKIAGLAAHGAVDPELLQAFQKLFHIRDGSIIGSLSESLPIGPYPHVIASGCEGHVRRIKSVVHGHPVSTIAATAQFLLEQIATDFVRFHVVRHGIPHVQVSGGVFANVRLNQHLAKLQGIQSLLVHPAMSDAGLALGAALDCYYRGRPFNPQPFKHAFWGPSYAADECEHALNTSSLPFRRVPDIERAVAELLATGHIVCRAVGRLEYGPRALGNRSILYRTDDLRAQVWLNNKLSRTETMPFAPATLDEHMDSCYEVIPAARGCDEFMTVTYQCRDLMRRMSPGVVHLDGSARPQRVCRDVNPEMHKILMRYKHLSGIPSLINTSFNLHEEPIVCSPLDAIRTFIDGDLDYMQLGPFLVTQANGRNLRELS